MTSELTREVNLGVSRGMEQDRRSFLKRWMMKSGLGMTLEKRAMHLAFHKVLANAQWITISAAEN